MPATEGYRPPGERTNHIAPPVRAINKQTIGYMNTDHGMALLPGRADWPSRPAFLDETTVVDHDLLQMLDPLPDGYVLGNVGTFTRSIGQGRLFVPGASAHQWASMWLTVQELEQLATMGAPAKSRKSRGGSENVLIFGGQ